MMPWSTLSGKRPIVPAGDTVPQGRVAPMLDAGQKSVRAALESLENVGHGKVTVSSGKLPDKLQISFDKSRLGKEPKLGLIATQIGFRDLFLIPGIAAILAAVLLALFFPPPQEWHCSRESKSMTHRKELGSDGEPGRSV